jgi:hypothetical protein
MEYEPLVFFPKGKMQMDDEWLPNKNIRIKAHWKS